MRFYLRNSEDLKEYEIRKDFSIGRSQGDLVLSRDPLLSSSHMKIVIDQGEPYLEDLGSSNGTWLNEIKLSPRERILLKTGDQIRVGAAVLSFQAESLDEDEKTRLEIPPIGFSESPADKTQIQLPPLTPPPPLELESPEISLDRRAIPGTTLGRPAPISWRLVLPFRYVERGLVALIVMGVLTLIWPRRTPQLSLPAPPKGNAELVPTETTQTKNVRVPVATVAELTQAKSVPPLEKLEEKIKAPRAKAKATSHAEQGVRAQLEVIRQSYQNTRSRRIKLALRLDATDLVKAYYKKRRALLSDQAKKYRSPATLKLREKKNLAKQLSLLNAEEQNSLDKLFVFLESD